jgi:hypothetical protein
MTRHKPHKMTSFEKLQSTTIDEMLMGLAKIGLISGMLYGVQTMAVHTVQTTGSQVEFRRKEDDTTEAERKRQIRKDIAEYESNKTAKAEAREKARERARFMAEYNRLHRKGQSLGIAIPNSYSFN